MTDLKAAHLKALNDAYTGFTDRPVIASIVSVYLASLEESGFVIAPREAAHRMICAIGDEELSGGSRDIYEAMIAARPRLTDG